MHYLKKVIKWLGHETYIGIAYSILIASLGFYGGITSQKEHLANIPFENIAFNIGFVVGGIAAIACVTIVMSIVMTLIAAILYPFCEKPEAIYQKENDK